MSSHVLSDYDQAVARKASEGVPPNQRKEIIDMHRKQIADNQRRRDRLVQEVEAIDRAIAMRQIAVESLGVARANDNRGERIDG